MNSNVYFWAIYGVIIVSAILALELESLLWAAVSFVVLLSEIALVYFSLGMPVLGSIQLAVYAGGVTILVLFAIMMIGEGYKKTHEKQRFAVLISISVVILGTILSFLSRVKTKTYHIYSTKRLGIEFTEKYSFFTIILGLIVSAILYLANAVISKKKENKNADSR